MVSCCIATSPLNKEMDWTKLLEYNWVGSIRDSPNRAFGELSGRLEPCSTISPLRSLFHGNRPHLPWPARAFDVILAGRRPYVNTHRLVEDQRQGNESMETRNPTVKHIIRPRRKTLWCDSWPSDILILYLDFVIELRGRDEMGMKMANALFSDRAVHGTGKEAYLHLLWAKNKWEDQSVDRTCTTSIPKIQKKGYKEKGIKDVSRICAYTDNPSSIRASRLPLELIHSDRIFLRRSINCVSKNVPAKKWIRDEKRLE